MSYCSFIVFNVATFSFRFFFAFATTIPTISFHSSLIFLLPSPTLFPFPTSPTLFLFLPFPLKKNIAMTEEEWLKAAIMDDTVVAELLLRLNQVNPSPSKSKKTGLPLEWTVRQRRSRPVSVNAKKPAPRASPTTPLSWSGATSVSGGGGGGSGGAVDGGCEESSGPPPPFKTPSSTRSKVNSTSDATTSKRSRKKKTLTELKEEEILLIKERKQLKKELALVRTNLEKQRDTNQNLKRMKLDLHPQQANERGTPVAYDGSLGQYQQEVLPSNPVIPIFRDKAANKVSKLPSYLEEQQDVAALESKFVLPDLNIPFGEDSTTEILCG